MEALVQRLQIPSKTNIPLPGLSTLRTRAAAVQLDPGVLDEVLSVMKTKGKDLTEMDKLCVLCFDEVYISQGIEINRKEERKVGSHKTVQLRMARGVFKPWRQPIYYNYDQPLTSGILKGTIEKLYDVGCTVIAATTGLGSTNSAVWDELHIGITDDIKCCFPHPRNEDLKFFVFADPPHLLKLIRNNLIDTGFHFENKFLNKQCLEEVLLLNKSLRFHIN